MRPCGVCAQTELTDGMRWILVLILQRIIVSSGSYFSGSRTLTMVTGSRSRNELPFPLSLSRLFAPPLGLELESERSERRSCISDSTRASSAACRAECQWRGVEVWEW